MPEVESYDKSGKFRVVVDANECLPAPSGPDPESGLTVPMKWLPCSDCCRLQAVPLRIVAFRCDACLAEEAGASDEQGI